MTAIKGPMRKIIPYLAVLRPLNGMMAAGAVMVGSVIDPNQTANALSIEVILLAISAFLITSGGNILNDLGDIDIDRKGHPNRPLASGAISEGSARSILGSIWPIGIITACFASLMMRATFPILIVMVSISLILVYEKKLKNKGLLGNISVGILTGVPFLLGGSTGVISLPVIVIFLMASFSNLSREIMKDIEDRNVDKGCRCTLPLRFGKKKAIIILSLSMIFAIFVSPIPLITQGFNITYFTGILFADLILLFSILIVNKDPMRSHRIAKLGMLLSILTFLIWSIG